jgi:hypothetical protein
MHLMSIEPSEEARKLRAYKSMVDKWPIRNYKKYVFEPFSILGERLHSLVRGQYLTMNGIGADPPAGPGGKAAFY